MTEISLTVTLNNQFNSFILIIRILWLDWSLLVFYVTCNDISVMYVTEGWVPVNQFNHTNWMAVVTSTDQQSLCNRIFAVAFWYHQLVDELSVGSFRHRTGQISFFFSIEIVMDTSAPIQMLSLFHICTRFWVNISGRPRDTHRR